MAEKGRIDRKAEIGESVTGMMARDAAFVCGGVERWVLGESSGGRECDTQESEEKLGEVHRGVWCGGFLKSSIG